MRSTRSRLYDEISIDVPTAAEVLDGMDFEDIVEYLRNRKDDEFDESLPNRVSFETVWAIATDVAKDRHERHCDLSIPFYNCPDVLCDSFNRATLPERKVAA